jgi:hypothetical protein
MATSYTTFLGLALPVTGELSGTWGDTVNNYISNYLDAAIAGAQTVTTDTTLTKTTGSSLGSTSSQYAIIIASPASANITITAPAASKIYTIINTSGTYTVTIRGAGPTTGVTLGVNEKAQVAWNGSDFVRIGASGGPGVFSSITNTGLTSGRVVYSTTGGLETDSANLLFNGTTLTANTLNLTNALGTTYGGTGLTSFTANGVVYASSSSALTTGSALVFDGTNLGLGVTPSAGLATANYRLLEIGLSGGGSLYSGNNQFLIGTNIAWVGSTANYKTSNLASLYDQSAGVHSWKIAPSGTAGNAITFTQAMTLDASGNLGIGTASPSGTNGAGYASRLTLAGTNTALNIKSASNTDFYIGATGGSLVFYDNLNSAERARIDSSGNLGIGTSSPNLGGASKGVSINGASSAILETNLAGSRAGYFYSFSASTILGEFRNLPLVFNTNDIERMRLDSSGNLGLGVTPSAWFTGGKFFQLTGDIGFTGTNNNSLRWNNYINSVGNADVYTATGRAAKFTYDVVNGNFGWSQAASGTLGNPVTFTQAMTLDASGNLGIGTSSPSYKIHASGTGTVFSSVTSTNGTAVLSAFSASGSDVALLLNAGGLETARITSPAGASVLAFGTGSAGTERMRLDSSGNLNVGVTSTQGGRLSIVAGANQPYASFDSPNSGYAYTLLRYNNTPYAYFGQASGLIGGASDTDLAFRAENALLFATGGGNERARIDSSGNLLVGQTTSGPLNVNGVGIAPAATGGVDFNHVTGTASGVLYARFNYAGSGIGSITQSGTTAVLYNLTSDQRLKENIQDAKPTADLIDAIQVRQFDWKSDGSHQRYGFVAQELVTVAPEAVHQPADPDEMMAVDYSKLVPMLVKEIQSLRIRIAQLEAK